MDGSCFDRLTKTLAGSRSRRRALGGMLAGGLGLLAAGAEDGGAHDLKAKCKKKKGKAKKKCLKQAKAHEATHTTTTTQAPPPTAECDPLCQGDLRCSNGACVCPSGTACGNSCISLGAACDSGLPGVCAAGTLECGKDDEPRCVADVEPGTQEEICDGLDNDCDGVVDNGFDLQTDLANCGRCGNPCSLPNATPQCVDGACKIATCDAGFAHCSSSEEDGCETQLGTIQNCSACGVECEAPAHGTPTCITGPNPGPGECGYTCAPGFDTCKVDGKNACCWNDPIDYCKLQYPESMSKAGGESSGPIYGRVSQAGVTEEAGAPGTITAQVGYGPAGSDPRTDGTWQYVTATYNNQVDNEDEYQGSFTVPSTPGTYAYVYRFSLDNGATWSYCDRDGSGKNPGLTFDVDKLGDLTVTP